MDRLRKVAATLATHGRHDLAREAAEISLQMKRASSDDLLDALKDVKEELLSNAKKVKTTANGFSGNLKKDGDLRQDSRRAWVGKLLDAYETMEATLESLASQVEDAIADAE